MSLASEVINMIENMSVYNMAAMKAYKKVKGGMSLMDAVSECAKEYGLKDEYVMAQYKKMYPREV